ncbi:exodeoxyribonuclease V subunit alpha [bacterium]|nr:exodeoxyribonuclease V subunit alpha [bacterium]
MIFGNKINILNDLKEKKLISGTDENLAEFLCGLEKNLSPEKKQVLAAAAALLSEWVSSGSICLTEEEIETFVETNKETLSETAFPDWEEINCVLLKSSCCTQDPENDPRPLVLSGDKIYFYKYWLYENSLASKVLNLSKDKGKYAENAGEIKNVFDKLFDEDAKKYGKKNFEQQIAAETVIKNRFSVITGGPGTGKTTTVAKIITGILSVCPEEKIILAAPTGKAAARMTEALRGETEKNINGLVKDEIIEKINSLEGQTLHRILGIMFNKPEKNRENPISADLIIVDETSMVDIAMFSALLDAVSDKTSLILLGDKDQLASVDAGNVLADICASRELLPEGTVSELKTSHRFEEHPAIGRLANAVNGQKSVTEIINICKEECDLNYREIKKDRKNKEMESIAEYAAKKYEFLSNYSLSPEEILKKLNDLEILCPSKEDFFGVDNINIRIAEALGKQAGTVYNGRPIMITRNDYDNTSLVNGDCGVILERNRETKAYFLQGDAINSFDISKLPAFETVYTMTIHKSQGSEYKSVLIVLPEREMPILTKELLYTAITRAKEKVEITAKESVLGYTLKNSASRNSGFKEALEKAGERS